MCGKISYDKYAGIRLLTTCPPTDLFDRAQESRQVYGTLETGERVLLEKCIPTHMQTTSYSSSVEYRATRMFVGVTQYNIDIPVCTLG